MIELYILFIIIVAIIFLIRNNKKKIKPKIKPKKQKLQKIISVPKFNQYSLN